MHYARDYRTLHGQHPGIAVISVIMFPKYNRLPHEPWVPSPAQTGKFFILQIVHIAWNSQGCWGLPMQNIHTRYLFCTIYKNTEYCYCCYGVIMFKISVDSKLPRAFSPAQAGKSFFILQLGSFAPPFTAWNSQGCSGLPMQNIQTCKVFILCYLQEWKILLLLLLCYCVSKNSRFTHNLEQLKVSRIANVIKFISLVF